MGCRSLGAGTCLTYYPFDAHYPPTLETVIHVRVGFGIPKNREPRKILKFGNPESQKSESRNFQDSQIPKIPIPKFGISVQFSRFNTENPEKYFLYFFDNDFEFFFKKSVVSYLRNAPNKNVRESRKFSITRQKN